MDRFTKVCISILIITLSLSLYSNNFSAKANLFSSVSISSQGIVAYNGTPIPPLLTGWGGVRTSEVNDYYSNMTFSDNFETGDFSQDSGYQGSIAVSNDWAAKGTYSARVTDTGTCSDETVYYNIGTDYSTVYEFWDFNVSAKTGTNNLDLGGFLQTSDFSTVEHVGITGASNDLFLCYQDGITTPQVTSATGISLNTDYTIEIMRTQSQTAGEYKVWLNGAQVNDLTVIGVNASSYASLPFLGNYYSATANATFYEDCWNVNTAFITNDPYVASEVFPGQLASDAELTMAYIAASGENTVRTYFEADTATPSIQDATYNQTDMTKFLAIAVHYNLWVDFCMITFYDQYQYHPEWLAQWTNIVGNCSSLYSKIVWEPSNEPQTTWSDGTHALTGSASVANLSATYQGFINMARGLGDTHWIIISMDCWQYWNFPTVTDPLNEIMINVHLYYNYEVYSSNWNVAAAQATADSQVNSILAAEATTGRPFVCTELGTSWVVGTPPDMVYNGNSGYTNVTLAYVQEVVNDLVQHNLGFVFWAAGDWAKDWSSGWHYGGLYGGMDVWGQLLQRAAFC